MAAMSKVGSPNKGLLPCAIVWLCRHAPVKPLRAELAPLLAITDTIACLFAFLSDVPVVC